MFQTTNQFSFVSYGHVYHVDTCSLHSFDATINGLVYSQTWDDQHVEKKIRKIRPMLNPATQYNNCFHSS